MGNTRVLRICIIVLVVCTAYIVTSGIIKIKNINAEREAAIKEAFSLEKELEKLKDELQITDSDEFIEKNAREDLGLVKPGEELVIVAQPTDDGGYDSLQSPVQDLEIGD